MITKLTLKNFKAHADTAIESKQITLLVGPNNSGKSSVLHALMGLRQALKTNAFAPRALWQLVNYPTHAYLHPPQVNLDFGALENVARRGHRFFEIEIASSFSNPVHGAASYLMQVKQNTIVKSAGSISLPVEPSRIEWSWVVGGRPTLNPGSFQYNGFPVTLGVQQGAYRPLSASVGNVPGMSSEAYFETQSTVNRFIAAPWAAIENVNMVYPTRGQEEVGLPIVTQPHTDPNLVSHTDRCVVIADLLLSSADHRRRISQWLKSLLNIEIDAEKQGNTVLITVPSSNSPYAFEGSGANQLIQILVPISLTQPEGVVLLSEPEAHLHPRAQYDIGKLLIKIARDERLQMFIETHSEHVLYPFLTAVAKRELTPGELAIYSFEMKDGISHARPHEINEKGQVVGGLAGFFEQDVRELYDYMGDSSGSQQ